MKNGYKIVTNVNRCAFTGDSLQIGGGCGSSCSGFTGDPASDLKAMDVLGSLPADTKLFCGHETARANLEFCYQVEPQNQKIIEKWNQIFVDVKNGILSVPSVLKDEKQFNVFMRCRTLQL